MGWITVAAVFLIAAILTVKIEEDFYTIFPVVVSGGILLLYGLAFFGALRFCDFISLGVILGIAIYGICHWKKKNTFLRLVGAQLFSAQSILLLVSLCLLTFLVKDKAAIWWDDVNYWAVDAKALYYNGGFAGKYGNVAPEFGDYPPALQLFKWFFLHFSKEFQEGLLFGAYHCMNVIYALPLLAGVKKKNPLFILAGLTGIFLLPGIIDGVAREGTCADVTMGIVYGAFLWAAYQEPAHKERFYFIRMALYLCVLVLTKSVGIEWACFGMFFFLLLYTKRLKEKGSLLRTKKKQVLFLGSTFLLTEASWLLFCYSNRRVAKLTGAGVKLAVSGNFTLPENTGEKLGHFLRGFSFYPMHSQNTWGVDLSSLALLLLVFFTVVFFYRIQILPKWEGKRLLLFAGVTAFASFGIIFLGHLTIFAGELQYLDDSVMAKSIARYGAPFSMGMLYLLLGIFLESKKSKRAYVLALAFVLLTTSLPGAYQTLYGYRRTLEEDIAGRERMVEEEAQIFLEQAAVLKAAQKVDFEVRTLYLRDDATIHWVKDTYISYAASPIPVVYGGIAAKGMTQQDMIKTIKESHAKYLYADAVEGNVQPLFAGMLTEEAFAYETFYEITEENGALLLTRIE